MGYSVRIFISHLVQFFKRSFKRHGKNQETDVGHLWLIIILNVKQSNHNSKLAFDSFKISFIHQIYISCAHKYFPIMLLEGQLSGDLNS